MRALAKHTLGSLALAGALAAAVVGAAVPARGAPVAPAGYSVVGAETLSPGVEHWRMHRVAPDEDVHVARIAPSETDRIRMVLSQDLVAGSPGLERTSSMCARLHCVAAVNGDFFDLSTRQITGAAATRGELVRTPGIRHVQLFLDSEGRPSAGHDLLWFGRFVSSDGEIFSVDGVNVDRWPDSLMVYTPRYGPSTPPSADAVELVLELVELAPTDATPDGVGVRLVELRSGGSTPLGFGRYVLSGTGADAAAVTALWGRVLDGSATPNGTLILTTGGVTETIGGSPWLLRGRSRAFPDNPDAFTRGRTSRTIAGWTEAGELLLVTVDSRQPGHSLGMSLAEAADLMLSLGAVDAVNLDGGGSTTFSAGSRVLNRPTDPGGERSVASSLVVLLPDDVSIGVAAARSVAEACPEGRVPEDGMLDLPDGAAHEAAVDCMVWWTVARGTGDGAYRPGDPVTRAQMASFLVRLLASAGAPLPSTAPNAFTDDDTSVHAAGIDRLAAAGIVTGVGGGRYRPEDPVTRDQMATFLVRAMQFRDGAPITTSSDFFVDDVGNAHEASINGAASVGVTGGSPDGGYRPEDRVTRSQMASFLSRALSAFVASRPVPLPQA